MCRNAEVLMPWGVQMCLRLTWVPTVRTGQNIA